ncbi:hypothetical protein [Arhodomonas sp. AD133]|uniref:hypothetical protein n=1 Tax=Arhodomonas sp. AD133 TaxID=3415009 RepID=UPI003EBEB722
MAEAIRLCLDYAQHRHNASVARVGELVGVTEWAIYKWLHEGSMPSARIRPFELACGCTFVTQYIASSARKLVIDIPSGRASGQADLLDLQNAANQAVSLLTSFYRDEVETDDVLQGVTTAMECLAGHRENVRKADEPELGLFEGDKA